MRFATAVVVIACSLSLGAAPPRHQAADEAPVEATSPADPRAALAVSAPAPEEALGLALWEARVGRADAALARVTEVAASAEGPVADRAAREVERLTAWRDLRDAYLADLATSGGKLTLLDGEARVKVTVTDLVDGVLHLKRNKAGWNTYPVDALRAGDLAQAMGKKASELAPGWVRLYGYALAGNDKWSKLLKATDAAGEAFRADAEADFDKYLHEGRCLFQLGELSAAEPPTDAAGADALLAGIKTLVTEGAGLPAVETRKLPLRGLAAIAHGVRFDELGLSAALNGKVTELDGGRIRVEYPFDSKAELADFAVDDGYMRGLRKRLGDIEIETRDEFWIKDGSLRCQGQAVRRHILPFSAPMTVEYDMSLDAPKSGELLPPHFFFGLCDDEAYRFTWCANFGDLETWNERDDVRRARDQARRGFELGRTHQIKLIHDGERVAVHRDRGEEPNASIATPHTSGTVFLWVHTGMHINLRRIVIEGAVDDEGRAALRATWIEEQLSSFPN